MKSNLKAGGQPWAVTAVRSAYSRGEHVGLLLASGTRFAECRNVNVIPFYAMSYL